jgi:predicted DNA-binding transcriptional regulator AlpA
MNLLKAEQVSEKLRINEKALPSLRRREVSFPQPIRVTERVLRWDEADIDNWLKSRKENNDADGSTTG